MPIDVDRMLQGTMVAKAEHWSTLSSTNDRAAELAARADVQLPLVVVADQQTAGRGRGGNRWWTGGGGLAFSLLVDAATVAATANRSPLVALATGVAVAESLALLLPGQNVGLHWPNDVFVDERKLAGILVEVLPNRRHVIGIGVNTNNLATDAPQELRSRLATLRDLTGKQYDHTELLIGLLTQLNAVFAQLREDSASVLVAANDLCLQRGQMLTVQRPDRVITGRCVGISSDGALLLDTGSGREACYSGVIPH